MQSWSLKRFRVRARLRHGKISFAPWILATGWDPRFVSKFRVFPPAIRGYNAVWRTRTENGHWGRKRHHKKQDEEISKKTDDASAGWAVSSWPCLYTLMNRQLSQRMTENSWLTATSSQKLWAKSVEPFGSNRDLTSVQSAWMHFEHFRTLRGA